MKFLFFLFICFYPFVNAQAFLNIEALRQHDKSGFFGATSFVFSGAQGNTNKMNARFSSQNIYNLDSNEFLSILNYSYGKANDKKNTDKGSLHLRYTRKLSKSWRAETFYQVQYNDFQKLIHRDLVGLGLREELLKSKTESLYAGQSLFYEYERFDDPSRSDFQEHLRLNLYLAYNRELGSKGTFVFILYYQPSLKKWIDYRVRANTGFSFNIWKNLNVDILLNYSFDRNLPATVKREDFVYYTGFKVSY